MINKMIFEFYFLFVLVMKCQGVIYNLNDAQYRSMPTLFTMDDYIDCNTDPEAIYCVADFHLFSETPSDLMNIIKEYSAHTIKHYNHTQIHKAVCLSETCKNYYQYKFNETIDLNATLEACINESIWQNYKIEAKIAKLHYCKYKESATELDSSDIIVAVVYAIIILLISIGSFYDVCRSKHGSNRGNAYLLAFSLKRNWKKLIAPAGTGIDPRLKRLKIINGMRAMTMICVIFSHTAIVQSVFFIANPLYIEKTYDDLSKQILLNGSLVVHTFFVMSSFLLAYNLQIYAESHKVVWTQIPKGIFLRWLRLTPPYALIIATISTWMRHLGDGPLWQMVVASESEMCRRFWWANVFYFNNYIFKDDGCFIQGWYLAADLQLFCLGLTLLVVVTSSRGRKVALSALFVASLLISAAHTYYDDLDAVVMQTPETLRSLYVNNRTYQLVYIRGHTNLSTYTMGLAAGLLTYYWQNRKLDLSKYKKYRWVVWIEFPLAIAVILSGGLFYIDGVEPSTWARVLYATFYKPIFQTLVASFMVLGIFRLDTVYRGIVEWRGFTWAGRVSYSAFLLHTSFQRGYIGAQIAPIYLTDYNVFVFLCASVFLSFLGGAVLWLAVEAPVAALIRAIFTTDRNDK